MPTVLDEIRSERARQVMKGHTPDHDDTHTDGSLRACVYDVLWLHGLNDDEEWIDEAVNSISDKPLRKQLVICAAMLVAEIERLDRQTLTEEAG